MLLIPCDDFLVVSSIKFLGTVAYFTAVIILHIQYSLELILLPFNPIDFIGVSVELILMLQP